VVTVHHHQHHQILLRNFDFGVFAAQFLLLRQDLEALNHLWKVLVHLRLKDFKDDLRELVPSYAGIIPLQN
jgi:hypothetical protein